MRGANMQYRQESTHLEKVQNLQVYKLINNLD
jgi:hypothetical protein